MDLEIFIKSLDEKERVQLYDLLSKKNEDAIYTDILIWSEQLHDNETMSTRLFNVIQHGFRKGHFLEEVTVAIFFKKRGGGIKAWTEFIKLRGY